MRVTGFFLLFCSSVFAFGQNVLLADRSTHNDSVRTVQLAEWARDLVYKKNDSALIFVDQSLQRAKSLKSAYLIALASDHKGIVLHELGEWKQAIAYIDSAINIWFSTKRYGEAGQSFLHLGNLYKSEGQMQELSSNFTLAEQSFKRALLHYQKAEQLFGSVTDSLWIGHAYLNQGAMHYLLYNNRRALQKYQASLRLFTKHQALDAIPRALLNMGIVYETLEKTDSAVYYYNRARTHFIENGNLKYWISANINLIEVNDFNTSLNLLLEADSLSVVLKSAAQKAMIQELLYRTYNNEGNTAKALFHLENYIAIKDSLLNADFKTEELNIRFKTARQQKLIEHQKAENVKKELSLTKARQERARLWAATIVVSFLLLSALAVFFWTRRMNRIIRKQKEKIHNQKLVELERDKELAAINAMIEGQTKERIRIAEDLHDRLGSVLVAARMQHEARAETSGAAAKQDKKVLELIDKAIEDTREISHNLISSVLVRFGLVPALRDLKESIEVKQKLKVDIGAEETVSLPSSIELQVFRAVQEMTNNTLKHADASHIHIQLTASAELFSLYYKDNGCGFDAYHHAQGLGLKNIEKRITSVGGKLSIQSSPGKGCSFHIEIPLSS